MSFVAIDVETANADLSSICQIGLATFSGREIIDEWVTLVDPQSHFDIINTSIHGLDEARIIGAPTFPEIADDLAKRLGNKVVVTHTHFDRTALAQAYAKSDLKGINCTWLDTARIARRTWEDCASSGYGLANLCEKIGYQFRHHDALEDAKAAGQILLAASLETGLDVAGWLQRVSQPIDPSRSGGGKAIERDGNPDGALFGEVLVFTGALLIPRSDASNLAARVGCTVAQGVTKKTTILCVGDQDVTRLAGHNKSSKHRKAAELIDKGQAIRIIRETDFVRMVELDEAVAQ